MNGKNFRDLRLAISCGGTGGHFYPGLSIAKILKKEGGSALLLLSGIHAQKQKKIAEECGIDAVALPEMPSPRRLKNVLKFFDGLFTGYLLAKRALKEHDIDIVLGMGSFTSLPPVFAAKKIKKKNLSA
jgi:UDP-N-acetylglucosamine--N-acetylmuramyl-(pentapeptide) pyrophosphoryl-undecaprenol N-acetylglucosamine transferase